ncbi:MAG: hypothetical protein EXS03_09885 [Phycisphaerales bacterium]|nr:hypothetical protein [Phycisphaerales bacterium]
MKQKLALAAFLGAVALSFAGNQGIPDHPAASIRSVDPAFVLELPSEWATIDATGTETLTDWIEVWKPMCGSKRGVLTADMLEKMALDHHAQVDDPDGVIVIDTPRDGVAAPFNLVFTLASTVPASAIASFTRAEEYLEARFTDSVTVTISCSFAAMGSGVLGGTSPSYTTATYTSARAGLVAGADASDTLQANLPTGTRIGVRYSGTSSTVTQEDKIYFTRANYKSTIGSVSGTDASMQFNNQFGWDYDPTNGVSGYSFTDVLIHEVGHAMGFVSAAGVWTNESTALDLFRFQQTDGTSDYNPDTLAEWTARPRLVAYNSPNDAHITDYVTVEYAMSDGSPYQASHFREQSSNIGIMDPAFSSGQTFYPTYMKTSDLNAFDGIGWDR